MSDGMPYAKITARDGAELTVWREPSGRFTVCSQCQRDLVPVVRLRRVSLRNLPSRLEALAVLGSARS